VSKRYRVKWCEVVEYSTNVWASDEDTALDLFNDLAMDQIPIEPTGWQEMKTDSIQVKSVDSDDIDEPDE